MYILITPIYKTKCCWGIIESGKYRIHRHDHNYKRKCPGCDVETRFKLLVPSRFTTHVALGLCYFEVTQNSTVVVRSVGLYFKEEMKIPSPMRPREVQAAHKFRHDQLMPKNVTEVQASRDLLLPVRLVDIQATLDSPDGGIYFMKPRDWSFHTVSHTWSKAVRDFSTSIGDRVTSAEAYDQAFQAAKLNEAPGEAGACYQSLMAFLRLLKEDGVKAIWIDALCINQTDDREKDREIGRMGTYYGQSLGCYVVTHGIGNGFKLWSPKMKGCTKKKECAHLPRWFGRVWTLQEFLLSRKVTFIVEGLAKKTIYHVNNFIRQGGVSGLCVCGLPKARCMWFRVYLKENKDGEEGEIICSPGKQTPCGKCERVQFIRKSHEQPGVYFVDREAYCFLCQIDLGPHEGIPRHLIMGEEENRLWNLFALSHYRGHKPIFRCVESIRTRKCTNEEDRVLGVLALLGVKSGQLQVRSGKTLNEQLLHLHQYCDATTFFKLCLMEPYAFELTIGMSWAPSLGTNHGYKLFDVGQWNHDAHFHQLAKIVSLSQLGLRLEARAARGRLVPIGQPMQCFPRAKIPKSTEIRMVGDEIETFSQVDVRWSPSVGFDGCVFCMKHMPHPRCTHWSRECDLQVGKTLTFPLKVHAREGCSTPRWIKYPSHQFMSVQDPWMGNSMGNKSKHAQFVMSFMSLSIHALKAFPVWLVLIGEADECMVGMVCISKDDMGSELHKIGVFACPKAHYGYDNPFFHGTQYWLISGFDVPSIILHTSED